MPPNEGETCVRSFKTLEIQQTLHNTPQSARLSVKTHITVTNNNTAINTFAAILSNNKNNVEIG